MNYRDEVIAYGSDYIRLDRAAEIAARADAEIAALRAQLAHIAEYWNRDQNERAMSDALWHIIETAEAAIDAARGEAT